MPKSLTQYRVFIGSPGGLEEERKRFGALLEKYSKLHGEPAGVVFHPVGWEDTLGGVGRPQELINQDLEPCDFAIFVFHDRWGTPTGSGKSSGTEEELEIAERLYAETKLRNIILFFKRVDARQLRDPGEQLKKVLEFKKKIESDKKYLFQQYADADEFRDAVEAHLARWLRDQGATGKELASPAPTAVTGSAQLVQRADKAPSFNFWIAEAERLLIGDSKDLAGAIFCAQKAVASAASDDDWANATNTLGRAQFADDPGRAYRTFGEVADRFSDASNLERRKWFALALVNKAVTLGSLNRSEEEIAVYDDVIARFGAATEVTLKEQLARALFNKGAALGDLKRSEEAIAIYDDVVARFGMATDASLRELIAGALVNKGAALGTLNRNQEAIAVYDDVVARFETAAEAALSERFAKALFNKGVALDALNRSEDAITIYDDVVARFGAAMEDALRERVAKALVNKGVALGVLNRSGEEVAVYDDVVARFGTAPELALKEQVAKALFNKGVTLSSLNRSEDAITAYEDVVTRFGAATEAELKRLAAMAEEALRALKQRKPGASQGRKRKAKK